LGGLGGDELFGNYNRSFLLEESVGSVFLRFQNLPEILRAKILAPCLNFLPDWKRFGFYKNKSVVVGNPEAGEAEFYRKMLDNFTSIQMRKLCLPDGLAKMRNSEALSDMIRQLYGKNNIAERGDKIFYVDMKTQLVDEYLCYTDLLSMGNSLEVRVPFLDHELVEFVSKIPYSVRSRKGEEKYLLIKTAEKVLPKKVFHRKKLGFSLPMDLWIRGDLRPVVEFFLSPKRVRKQEIFNCEYVQHLLKHHFNKIDTFNTHPIWTLFMFQLWHWIYLENNCTSEADVTELCLSLEGIFCT